MAAQSEVVKLRSQFGQVAEFPLMTPLPVVRGEILALTIPTWAPVLSIEQPTTKFSYSQSRAKQTLSVKSGTTTKRVSSCNQAATVNLAQIVVGELSSYGCNYAGTRIEYSALEITTPAGFTSQARRRLLAKRRAAARVAPPLSASADHVARRAQACRAGTTRRRARPDSPSRRR